MGNRIDSAADGVVCLDFPFLMIPVSSQCLLLSLVFPPAAGRVLWLPSFLMDWGELVQPTLHLLLPQPQGCWRAAENGFAENLARLDPWEPVPGRGTLDKGLE